MGLGLQWAGANDAMAQQIRQQIVDRLQAQQVAKNDAQQQFENDYKNRALAQQDDLRKAALQEHADQMKGASADRAVTEGLHVAETIPGNTFLPENSPSTASAVGSIRGAHLDPLLQQQPAIEAQGNDFQGPTQPGISQQDMITGRVGGVLKLPTQNQSEKTLADQRAEAEAQRKADADAAKGDNEAPVMTVGPNGQPVYTSRASAIGQRAYVKPNDATVVVQTIDAQGNPVSKIVPKTAGSEFASKPSAQSERQQTAVGNAAKDAQAVQDEIDKADKAGILGPALGRGYGKFLAGMVGSTGDTAIDRQLGNLKGAIQVLKNSYPMAISGTSKGGGGVSQLTDLLNSDKSSADLLQGVMDQIHGALNRRSGKPSGASGSTSSVEDLIKKYGQPQQD